MPGSSALNSIRTNLQTQLQARGNLSGVAVSRHRPAPDDIDGSEHIWFSDARGRTQPGSVGSREDEIALEIHIRVTRPGGDETEADAVEDRALALFAELEAQLVTDPTVNGACLTWNDIDYETDLDPGESEWVYEITATVTFETELANS